MSSNPTVSFIIREEKILDCFICYEEFDIQTHSPMMICENQHNICQDCVKSKLFKEKQESLCPLCNLKITKQKVSKNRTMVQICKLLETFKSRETQLKDRVKMVEKQNEDSKTEIQKLKIELKEEKKKSNKNEVQSPVKVSVPSVHIEKLDGFSFKFILDKSFQGIEKFTIDGNKFTKTIGIGFYYLTTTNNIPNSGIHKLGIRIIKSEIHSIEFGVWTETSKKNPLQFYGVETFSCRIGGGDTFWEEGKSSGKTVEKIKQGNILYMLVNLDQMKVEYYHNDKFLFFNPLNKVFREKKIYPYIRMGDKGDCVEVV